MNAVSFVMLCSLRCCMAGQRSIYECLLTLAAMDRDASDKRAAENKNEASSLARSYSNDGRADRAGPRQDHTPSQPIHLTLPFLMHEASCRSEISVNRTSNF